jgi:DNA polymerase-3 subunit alpha
MAFLTLEDGISEVEVTVFPRILEGASALLSEDQLIGLRVTVGKRNGDLNLVVDEAFPLDQLPSRVSLSVTLTLKEEEVEQERLATLCNLIQEYPGTAPVLVRVEDGLGGVEVRAGQGFCVDPSSDLLKGVETLLGKGRIRFRAGNI